MRGMYCCSNLCLTVLSWLNDHPPVLGFLPDHSVEFLQQHIFNPASTTQQLRRYILSTFQIAFNAMVVALSPLADRLIQALYNSPDVVVLIFFLVLLFILAQVALLVHRVMMFFTRLAYRLLFWATIAALAAVVWQIGPEATARYSIVIGSKIVGYLAGLVAVFQQEYQKYDAQAKAQPGSGATYSSSGRSGWK